MNINLDSTTKWIETNRGLVTIITLALPALLGLGISLIVIGQSMRMLTSIFYLAIIPLRVFAITTNLVTGVLASLSRIVLSVLANIVRLSAAIAFQLISSISRLAIKWFPELTMQLLVFSVTLANETIPNMLAWAKTIPNLLNGLITIATQIANLTLLIIAHSAALTATAIETGAWMIPVALLVGLLINLQLATNHVNLAFDETQTTVTAFSEACSTLSHATVALAQVGLERLGRLADYFNNIFIAAWEDGTNRVTRLIPMWLSAYNRITTAVQSGDLTGAFNLLWANAKVTWQEGVNFVMNIWDKMIEDALNGLTRLGTISAIVWDSIKRSMLEVGRTAAAAQGGPVGVAAFDSMISSLGLDESELQKFRDQINSAFDAEHLSLEEKKIFDARRKHFEEMGMAREKALQQARLELWLLNRQVDAQRELEKEPMFGPPEVIWTLPETETLEGRIKDLIGVGDVSAPAGVAPTALMGLQKGSVEAAKAIQEAEFDKMQLLLGDIKGILEAIRDKEPAIEGV